MDERGQQLITETGLHNLQAHLLIMETIFSNSIKSNYNTPKYTLNNIQLLPHQNRLITALWKKENQLRTGKRRQNDIIFSKVGFIGDPINTGLFQTMLAFIKHCKSTPQNNIRIKLNPFSTPLCFSLTPSTPSYNKCNLLIVSNNYLPLIKQLIENQTEINSLLIKRQNQLTQNLLNNLATIDLLIVPASQANNTITWTNENNYTFHRCFIDDMAALGTHSRDLINSEFTWILTEHWTKLIWPELDFADLENVLENTLASILPNPSNCILEYIQFQKLLGININTRSLLFNYVVYNSKVSQLIVLSDPNAIRESMQISPESRTVLKYSYDEPLQILYSLTSSHVASQIANNNIINAMQSVGAQIISPDNWRLEKNIYIRDNEDDTCPICYEQLSYPTVTDCCRKIFCATCILQACRAANSCICPMCRRTVIGNRLLMVAELTPPPNYLYENKIRTLCNYMSNNRNKKQLVYFPHEPRLGKLKASAKLKNLPIEILTGTYYDCKRKIDAFNSSTTGIIVITDLKQLHGGQLPSTAILILYPDNTALSIQNILRMHTYSLTLPLEVVVFVEDAALATTGTAVSPGAALAACGVINTSLGDSSVATSHT